MIQSTRISMGLFFKYFLSLTKIDPGQNYISLPSIKSSTHIALLFMVSMGTQKLKAIGQRISPEALATMKANLARTDALKQIAVEKGATLAQLAIA